MIARRRRQKMPLTPSSLLLSVLVIVAVCWTSENPTAASAFVVQESSVSSRSTLYGKRLGLAPSIGPTSRHSSVPRGLRVLKRTKRAPSSSSALNMTPILSFVKSATMPLTKPLAKRMLLVLGVAAMLFLSKQYTRILWPGSSPDSALSEPLPPGSLGCPFFGNNIMAGTREYGPYVFFDRANTKLNNPSLFKLYAFGMPMVSVRGSDNIKTVLKDEFDPNGVNTELVGESYTQVFGNQSIIYESDGKTHGFLRRLVGAAMTPAAVANAIPAIQKAANERIDIMLSKDTVKMEDVCNDFTLDVAWRQILGLDLTRDEVPTFYQNVKVWVGGIFNPLFALPFKVPGIRFTKCYKAHKYLVSKVEEKLAQLDANGPDGSTLSGIYYATDDDNDSRKLSRQQVIDNALILIVAGSETSASTLTVASLLLGLHKDVWNKVKEEQAAMVAKYGDDITSKAELDAECPYLDSVIRETLRLRPVPATEIRRTSKSIILNGMQIPKNWMLWLNIRSTHDNDPITMKQDGSHMDIKLGFKPERWNDAATKPSEWMPFGSGARRCLGENLAMTEMKVFLATLARRVDYDLVGSTDEILWKRMSVMPRPLDGVEVAPRPMATASNTAS